MALNAGKKPLILVGEDDPADRDLIRRTFGQANVELELLGDGEEVVNFLKGTLPPMRTQQRPDLVIVDLNMPRLNGRQVLQLMREKAVFEGVPVVIFSSSNREADIAACYEAGCTSYVVKPTDLEPFMGALNLVASYWLDLVEKPTDSA